MIKIKDYIFNENKILAIHKDKMNGGIDFEYENDKFKTFPDATFEDIEWNYENFNNCKKLEEEILSRDVIIKELEEENKKLKNVINELSRHLVTTFNKTQNTDYLDIKIKLDELVKGEENE